MFCQEPPPVYSQLKAFDLAGGAYHVANLSFQSDQIQMRFDGTFYSESPVEGKVRGAVFLGEGTVQVDPPPVKYEQENLRRLLKADRVDSSFKSAVLRFTDDTWEKLALTEKAEPDRRDAAQKLAREFAPRMMKETGINPNARVAASIVNGERPGLLLLQFEGGKLGRFTAAIDPTGTIPSKFGLNGGEQGVVYTHHGPMGGNDIWLAFPIQSGQKVVPQLLSINHYAMKVDLREVSKGRLAVEAALSGESSSDALRAVNFDLNDDLDEYNDERLKRALRCEWAKESRGEAIPCVQEPWESGLTVFLPKTLARGAKTALTVKVSGEAMQKPEGGGYFDDVYYPRSTSSWYPTHGFLQRSTYDLVFLHTKRHKALSIGVPYAPEGSGGNKELATGWKMDKPVFMATFVVGDLKQVTRGDGSAGVPVEYFWPSINGGSKQDYMLTELDNDIGFFTKLFGPYPFQRITAVVHPRAFGQGFPSMLLLAPTGKQTNKSEFSFFAHETAHQWWGHVVGWQTYRDQWLSEGFAEYSGALYVRARMNRDAELELVRTMRKRLLDPPETETGIGQGRVADLGPIVLGLRAASPATRNAYYSLVYWKGALVLRMIHFLFTHPGTGDDTPFFTMMKDFTSRYAGKSATTQDFFAVAAEHIRRAPLGLKYKMQDLDWFYRQWVLQAILPSYRIEYQLEPQGSGVLLKGTLYQDGTPDDWFMPLPLEIKFGKQSVHGSIEARGPQSKFSIPLPQKPTDVVLDPSLFVLSEKTESVKKGG
jgi:hypothetical protein